MVVAGQSSHDPWSTTQELCKGTFLLLNSLHTACSMYKRLAKLSSAQTPVSNVLHVRAQHADLGDDTCMKQSLTRSSGSQPEGPLHLHGRSRAVLDDVLDDIVAHGIAGQGHSVVEYGCQDSLTHVLLGAELQQPLYNPAHDLHHQMQLACIPPAASCPVDAQLNPYSQI